jgi:hypothetical protein
MNGGAARMSWCPKCRNEYMEEARRCADCEVDLVSDLSAHDRAVATAAAERCLRIEGPAETLTSLRAWLERARIPVRGAGEGLEIPFALAEQVESALMRSLEYEREGETLTILGPVADREPEYEVDPALLRRSPEEVAATLAESLPKLAALLGAGTLRQKVWALQTLRALEGAGVVAVVEFVLQLVRSGFRRPLYALTSLLAESPHPGIATRVAKELPRFDRRGLELALHVLAQLKDRTVARAVLPYLDHEDPDVRAEADEVLMCVADRDLGFEAEADPAARASVVKLWREWVDRETGA